MITTRKVHQRFFSHWMDYKNRDLIMVCTSVLKLMKIEIKGNALQQVKDRWAQVCSFLIQWNGEKQS